MNASTTLNDKFQVVGARQAGLNITDLMGILNTSVSSVYAEWWKKQTKETNKSILCAKRLDDLIHGAAST